MIAKIAYLTSPSPGVFMLNIQPEDCEGILRFEIAKAHLANILIDGTALALRDSARPNSTSGEQNAVQQ